MVPRGHLDTSPSRWWLQVDSKLFSLVGWGEDGWVGGRSRNAGWVGRCRSKEKEKFIAQGFRVLNLSLTG